MNLYKYETISSLFDDKYVSEGLLFNDIEEINIKYLNDRKPLIVFSTNDTIEYGGINPDKYLRKYKYKKAINFNYYDFIEYLLGNQKFNTPAELDNKLKNSKINLDAPLNETMDKIINAIDEYVKESNNLVVILMESTKQYGCPIVRDYPIIINKASMTIEMINDIKTFIKKNSARIKGKNNFFKNRFSNNIPENLFVKNLNCELFHISTVKGITKLEPKISPKTMSKENIRIPRISAAPTVKNCIKALYISLNKDEPQRKYYVYKLKLTNKHRIVKPSLIMVPDVNETNEYWILDPVEVECVMSFVVRKDKDDKLIYRNSEI